MSVPARALMAASLAVLGALPPPPASAATMGGIASLTVRPLPMAVEGGALAEVTAHGVPFALGSSRLQGGIAAALEALLATAATDCFLFAQVVGHVQPGQAADGDTRAAHRLARARADAVTAALQRAGVPPGSVTATWDFGFTTPQPRATLWLFERAIGADCHGTPLQGSPPVAVAAASDPLEPAPGIHLTAPGVTASTVRSAARVDWREPAPGIHLPEPAATPPLAALASADIEQPAVIAPEPQAGPADPGKLEITFEPDSSFLSAAATAELDGWLSALPGGAAVCRVELSAAVGDRAGHLQQDKAQRYNEWLAERRQSRVADRVRERAGCEVRRALRPHDDSRSVSIRLAADLADQAEAGLPLSRTPAPAGSPASPAPHPG